VSANLRQVRSSTIFVFVKNAYVSNMKTLIALLLWLTLLVLSWPLALLVMVLLPLLWIFSIPFRIVGAVARAVIAFVSAILFLPARLLGRS
jgi:hypothetical protein